MHILIVPPSVFITEQQPLNGIFQLHQARALSTEGYKVGVLSVGVITPRYLLKRYPYASIEKFEGFVVYRKYNRIIYPWRFKSQKKICDQILNQCKVLFKEYIQNEGAPDIVHVHNFLYAGIIGEYLKSEFNIPFIVTEHSSLYENSLISSVDLELVKKISRATNATTAVSTSLSLNLSNMLDSNVSVLPNVIDPLFLINSRKNTSVRKHQEFTFFNAASLDFNKNHSLLLQSFAKSFAGKPFSLRIAGEGPLLSRLKRESKNLGISEQVKFLGRLTHEKICEEMMASNCFVLSSNYETFGVVLIEALACGIPVISSACGGTTDIVDSSVGYLFEPRNANQLSLAMEEMVLMHKKFLPEQLSNYVEKKFGSQAFISKYNALLASVKA